MTMPTHCRLPHCEKKPPLCVPEEHGMTHTFVQTNTHCRQTPDLSFDFKVLRLALALIVAMKA